MVLANERRGISQGGLQLGEHSEKQINPLFCIGEPFLDSVAYRDSFDSRRRMRS